MAVATALQPTQMPNLTIWFGFVVFSDASTIIISDGVRTTEYTGSFVYSPLGDVSGTLTGVTESVNGQPLYTVTDINADASEVYFAIQILADQELTVNRFDNHPNEFCHKVVAAAIADQLLSDLPVNTAKPTETSDE